MEGCDDPLELDEDVALVVDEVDLTGDVLLVRGLLPGLVNAMELLRQVTKALLKCSIGGLLGVLHGIPL